MIVTNKQGAERYFKRDGTAWVFQNKILLLNEFVTAGVVKSFHYYVTSKAKQICPEWEVDEDILHKVIMNIL